MTAPEAPATPELVEPVVETWVEHGVEFLRESYPDGSVDVSSRPVGCTGSWSAPEAVA